MCKGERFAFGHGIYSTPDIDIACDYAPIFKHEGNNYRAVIQNRVNPNNLVRVSKQENGDNGEYWISPNEADVRPYGICIKKENATQQQLSQHLSPFALLFADSLNVFSLTHPLLSLSHHQFS